VLADHTVKDGSTDGGGNWAAPALSRWLGLAAAPTFAVAAWWGQIGAHPDICTAVHGSHALSGMTLMYLLMSVFHASPWLKLIADRRNAASGRQLLTTRR